MRYFIYGYRNVTITSSYLNTPPWWRWTFSLAIAVAEDRLNQLVRLGITSVPGESGTIN